MERIARIAMPAIGGFLVIGNAPARAQDYVDAAAKPYEVLGGIGVAIVFLAAGWLVFLRGWKARRLAAASKGWPSTIGAVESATIEKRTTNVEDRTLIYYMPQIKYSYAADGKTYRGQTIKIGFEKERHPSQKEASDYIARYAPGSGPTVRFDPNDPQTAVLELGQVGGGPKIFSGAIFILVGIASLVFVIWTISLPTD